MHLAARTHARRLARCSCGATAAAVAWWRVALSRRDRRRGHHENKFLTMLRRLFATATTTRSPSTTVKRWKVQPNLAYKHIRDNRESHERNCRDRNMDECGERDCLSVFGSTRLVSRSNTVSVSTQVARRSGHQAVRNRTRAAASTRQATQRAQTTGFVVA